MSLPSPSAAELAATVREEHKHNDGCPSSLDAGVAWPDCEVCAALDALLTRCERAETERDEALLDRDLNDGLRAGAEELLATAEAEVARLREALREIAEHRTGQRTLTMHAFAALAKEDTDE